MELHLFCSSNRITFRLIVSSYISAVLAMLLHIRQAHRGSSWVSVQQWMKNILKQCVGLEWAHQVFLINCYSICLMYFSDYFVQIGLNFHFMFFRCTSKLISYNSVLSWSQGFIKYSDFDYILQLSIWKQQTNIQINSFTYAHSQVPLLDNKCTSRKAGEQSSKII